MTSDAPKSMAASVSGDSRKDNVEFLKIKRIFAVKKKKKGGGW